MPLLTHGAIGVTPIRLDTAASLENLRDAAIAKKPRGSDLEPGWGSLGDSTDLYRVTGAPSPMPGDPAIVEADEYLPRRLEMRGYWWSVERAILKHVGADNKRDAMRLEAVDVVISPASSGDGQYLVLVSSRNRKEINEAVRPLISRLEDSLDSTLLVSLDTSPLDLVSDDFFLWLLYKTLETEQISTKTDTLDVREVRSIDRDTRETHLSRGVGLDRAEFLALLCKANPRFGPIKLLIEHKAPELMLDCEIDLRGAYSIVKSGTGFKANVEDVEPEYLNVLYALHYAHVVYPELVSAWNADIEWGRHKRDAFYAKCRQMLAKFSSQSSTTA